MDKIRKRAFNKLLEFCIKKYDLFDRDDKRLKKLFDKHFNDRVQVYKDDYYWTPELDKDYWLHKGPSGMSLSLFESEVVDFWTEIETIWYDQLRNALHGHNDVPACLPFYQFHFASEEHPITH